MKESALKKINKHKWLYIIFAPGALYFILFKYLPMWGVLVALKDFSPFLGFWGSPWVGFKHFENFFINPDFVRLFTNTLILSLMNIVFFFPAPIILALLLNEIRKEGYKKLIQTLVYVPHFISMIIVASITFILFNTQIGVVNNLLEPLIGTKIAFLSDPEWFRPLIIGQTIWKETGWGTIIFLAALAGVDASLYEAAVVDGAGRLKQLWHITLPSIKSTIVIMLILRMGTVLDNGFEQIFVMTNSLNRSVADVFDTYVYKLGITQGAFSYSTAVGLFKSLIGLILIYSTNKIAKKLGETGLF